MRIRTEEEVVKEERGKEEHENTKHRRYHLYLIYSLKNKQLPPTTNRT
jgi:hypothetical protein